ncbi:MAG TPA: hypothetical protein VJB37_00205 [Patescibacteria group bacterium]|nr:hypothetical protein [Patescibacteria group bacterium]
MFDDQNFNKSAAGATPPSNLPVGEPDDMFSGVEKGETGEPATMTPIAPAMPSALDNGRLRAKPTLETETMPNPSVPSAPNLPSTPDSSERPEMYPVKGPTLTRIIVTVLVVLLVLGGLGLGGWWLYNNYMLVSEPNIESTTSVGEESEVTSGEEGTEEVILPGDENTTGTEAMVPSAEDVEGDILDEELLFGEPLDKDGDGLDDSFENDLGTDPNNWDTDGDGLGDRDEVSIWKTDPLNPDTDGDTYLDGAEVKNGYSPTGSGKLFEPPTEAGETTMTETTTSATTSG